MTLSNWNIADPNTRETTVTSLCLFLGQLITTYFNRKGFMKITWNWIIAGIYYSKLLFYHKEMAIMKMWINKS